MDAVISGRRPDDAELFALAQQLGEVLKRKSLILTTAESCTGGWIGRVITAVPGSSAWYEGGFITYTNTAKISQLDVRPATLASYGAVSEPVVREMAQGALQCAQAQIAVAVSGIAGPGGGTAEKPVGTVCLGWTQVAGAQRERTFRFGGDREAVRAQAVAAALRGLLELLAD